MDPFQSKQCSKEPVGQPTRAGALPRQSRTCKTPAVSTSPGGGVAIRLVFLRFRNWGKVKQQ